MEITQELLITLRKRLEQVYFAKTNDHLDNITMLEDGSFDCSKTYSISYGGTEIISENITSEDLTADLDELVKIREAKEEIERKERDKRDKENNERYERERKAERLAKYKELKKEFEPCAT